MNKNNRRVFNFRFERAQQAVSAIGSVDDVVNSGMMIYSEFGIVLDDWIRYWIFKEELPHYKII